MELSAQSEPRVRFEEFELNLHTRELQAKGRRLVLQEQPFQILAALLERPGHLVNRDDLRQRLWSSDTFVDFERGLNKAVNRLREVLEDSPDQPRFIETLPRQGYRFIATVERTETQSSAALVNLIGKKVSHYRVLEIVGGGCMGVVYKAEDLKLGRRVALKFLPEELGNDGKALERFEREARAASALDHPNICSIYEFGEHEGQPFIVMQLLEGQTLRERIGIDSQHAKPLPTRELLDLAIQITHGLEAAHQKGITHRDIKPANIFITNRGEAKILDFGVAELGTEWAQPNSSVASGPIKISSLPDTIEPTFSSLTLTGANLGTASYMSPEQILGKKLDPRSDLFSLGLVLHEMATGQHAFGAETAELVREAILHRPVQPASEINPELPAELTKLIVKTLGKERETRYQTASEIRADLTSIRNRIRPTRGLGYRARWWEIAVGTFLFATLGVALWFFGHRLPSHPGLPELKQQQLTDNSNENAVVSGSISPNGRYLAYADTMGMKIKSIETGQLQTVVPPDELRDQAISWRIMAWFPDGARFLANAFPRDTPPYNISSRGTSIWTIPLTGEQPQKLRADAFAYSVSPDGSLVSFGASSGKVGDREIWLMGPNGEQPRKLYSTDDDSAIGGLIWSPDGKRTLYQRVDKVGFSLLSNDLTGGSPTIVFPASVSNTMQGYVWLPDGRLIYPFAEPKSSDGTCNFWEVHLDERTGKSLESPRRIASWSEFCMSLAGVTSDGRKLVFLKSVNRFSSYMAELDITGSYLSNPRHFSR